jgi:DNA-binding PadR family transcriptional regulator
MPYLQPNDFQIVLLSLLDDKPKHAYELMQRLEGGKGGTARELYPALQQLYDEGPVNIDATFGWRTYWLSVAGKLELRRKTNLVSNHWLQAGRAGFPTKARVARFAVRVIIATLRAACHGHAERKNPKICETLENTKREIGVWKKY